ncbi:helix-turn-helix transcriptional regulator [Jiangella rhizosphaerae]|uniref:DNA-binding response regulator n=1 Tax=Jiangella rhizosphaerae TaxID=2293569 RepID=A0A418KHL8_9ACTN|nr:LuxR C-terminal-related transcriptional regulator [Jiangella rhizosphaerae]RIQ11889.1 DNA-binding response regulator [Jiangella rhizosphaerae]
MPVVLIVDQHPAPDLSVIGTPGVRGVVVSSDPPETLALGIMAAASHGVWLPEAVWEQVSQRPGPELLATLDSLTAAETETLRLVARGLSYREIARVRHVQLSTVKYHVGNIRLKTGASNRQHLIILAHEAAAARIAAAPRT